MNEPSVRIRHRGQRGSHHQPHCPQHAAPRLAGDLGTAIAPGGDAAAILRAFLAPRILGAIPLGQMSDPDAAACLAKLAVLSSPAPSLHDGCATTHPAPLKQAVANPPACLRP
jgi:hypothetical protein